MNYEILAPAGSRPALDAAFAAGADAVYFGLPSFGARAFAKNFTLDEAGEIIEQAHKAGRKIYITMNTLLEESDLPQAYEYARALHEMGVDALIIQDLGLIHLLHHRLPNLELHASTQLSVSTPRQIEQLRKLGVSRVVLAREATLDEIRACAATGMELEAFVHGALCISYSGQCRFSQIRYGRSGNKGACAQPCRMEYTLKENGKSVATDGSYLLSPKDLSLVEEADRLVDAGVFSLKIEGRMKSPEYVFASVHALKKSLQGQKLSKEDRENLKIAFNRGYTRGHAFEQKGSALMNSKTSNHRGIPIGKVLSVSRDRVKVRLERELHQHDGLRFINERSDAGQIANFLYDAKGRLISGARAGDTVEIKTDRKVYPGAAVVKTSSEPMTREVHQAVSQMRLQVPVRMKLQAKDYGSPLILEVSDGVHTISVQSDPLQKANKSATTRGQIEKQLAKTGDTWAKVETIDIDLPPEPFLPVRTLNELRRQAIEALEARRLEKEPMVEKPYDFHPEQPAILPDLAVVSKPCQLEDDGLLQVSEYGLPGTQPKAAINADNGLVTDHLGNGKIVSSMNLTNSYALAALLELGYQGGVLSEELSEEGRKALMKAFKERYGFEAPVIKTVYEKPRLMVMKHCPVNTALKDGQRQKCSLCRQNEYVLEGKDGRKSELYGSADCRMQLFDQTPVDSIDRIEEFDSEGIHAFGIVLTTEDRQQSEKIRSRFIHALWKVKSEPAPVKK